MKVKYILQINDVDKVAYQFNDDVITATLDGKSDTFDFTDMPNDSETKSSPETTLRPLFLPVISAKRDSDGVLWVELFKAVTEGQYRKPSLTEWEDV